MGIPRYVRKLADWADILNAEASLMSGNLQKGAMLFLTGAAVGALIMMRLQPSADGVTPHLIAANDSKTRVVKFTDELYPEPKGIRTQPDTTMVGALDLCVVNVETGESGYTLEVSPERCFVLNMDLSSITEKSEIEIRIPFSLQAGTEKRASCTVTSENRSFVSKVSLHSDCDVQLLPSTYDGRMAYVASGDDQINDTVLGWEAQPDEILIRYTYQPTEQSHYTQIYMWMDVTQAAEFEI